MNHLELDTRGREICGILESLVAYQTTSAPSIANMSEFTRSQFSQAQAYIAELGLRNGLFVEPINHHGMTTLIVSTQKTKTPNIAFIPHLDVVAAKPYQWQLAYDGEWITGRGTADDKGPIAIALQVLIDMPKGDFMPSVSLIIPPDEESGGANGMRYLVEDLGYRPDIVFCPDDGPNWQFVEKSKGDLLVRFDSYGIPINSSRLNEKKCR